jgi:hypothetical protein
MVMTSKAGPVSRETGFQKLRSIKCFQEVHQKLVEGWGLTELAKWIQKDRQEYTDVKPITLVHLLKDYRNSLPPGTLIEKRMPNVFHKAAKRVKKGLDEVKELEDLVKFQKRRIKMEGNTERKIGKLLPTMTQEVRTMRECLATLADVKMDLGLSKRHLGELNVDATLLAEVVGRYGSPAVAKVLQNPQSRQKVMGVAEKFLALAASEAAKVVDVTPEPVPAKSDEDMTEAELEAQWQAAEAMLAQGSPIGIPMSAEDEQAQAELMNSGEPEVAK